MARFIGVLNVLDLEVKNGWGRAGELKFPAPDHPDGSHMRIGFRPFAVKISSSPNEYPYKAVLRHTFFLGIMLRVELELPSGVVLRARMTKEEYAQLGLRDGQKVSVLIKSYRVLSGQNESLSPEIEATQTVPPILGEGI